MNNLLPNIIVATIKAFIACYYIFLLILFLIYFTSISPYIIQSTFQTGFGVIFSYFRSLNQYVNIYLSPVCFWIGIIGTLIISRFVFAYIILLFLRIMRWDYSQLWIVRIFSKPRMVPFEFQGAKGYRFIR